jgi:hypothetical protein
VIALPFNDLQCLGSITEVVAELVANQDPVIVELAKKHATTESLVDWIRSLPQRDDEGDKTDGPRLEACEPSQRLRIPAHDMNCVERSATYVAVAELIDPQPVRQLATLDTPVGLHTFPVENGAPVILDPRVPRNALEGGLFLHGDGPIAIEARDAIEWTARWAEAGAADFRNGPSRVRRARTAIMRLVDDGAAPASPEVVEAIGWMLAMAEKVARKYGPRAMSIVRTTAQAVADLAEQAIARSTRNMPWALVAAQLIPDEYRSALAKIAGRVAVNVGSAALKTKLNSLGIGDDMIGMVESELNREGLTMGPLAKPTVKLPTFGSSTASRAG